MATQAKLDGNRRYHEKLDRIVFRVHKDGSDDLTKEQIENAAKNSGMSVNQWLIDVIKENL